MQRRERSSSAASITSRSASNPSRSGRTSSGRGPSSPEPETMCRAAAVALDRSDLGFLPPAPSLTVPSSTSSAARPARSIRILSKTKRLPKMAGRKVAAVPSGEPPRVFDRALDVGAAHAGRLGRERPEVQARELGAEPHS